MVNRRTVFGTILVKTVFKIHLLVFVSTLFLFGCATSPTLEEVANEFRTPQFDYPKTSLESVHWLVDVPPEKYNIVGNIFIRSDSDWPVFEKALKKIASEMGADAVIIYSRGEFYDAIAKGKPCLLLRYGKKKYLYGKAIKYLSEGETPRFRYKGITVGQWTASVALIKRRLRLQINEQKAEEGTKYRKRLSEQIIELNQPLREQGFFTLADDEMAVVRLSAINELWPELTEIHSECDAKLWKGILEEYLRSSAYKVSRG